MIGQCFTGGFALAAAVDDAVLAPVLSQPSVPLSLTPKQRRDAGLSEVELGVVADRAANEGLCAIGLRFSEDWMAPRERFGTLKARLGEAFEVIEIDSSPGNPHGISRLAHSVLTDQVREVEGIRPMRPASGSWSSSPSGWLRNRLASQPPASAALRLRVAGL